MKIDTSKITTMFLIFDVLINIVLINKKACNGNTSYTGFVICFGESKGRYLFSSQNKVCNSNLLTTCLQKENIDILKKMKMWHAN